MRGRLVLLAVMLACAACSEEHSPSSMDAAVPALDAGADAGPSDAGTDAQRVDAGPDCSTNDPTGAGHRIRGCPCEVGAPQCCLGTSGLECDLRFGWAEFVDGPCRDGTAPACM